MEPHRHLIDAIRADPDDDEPRLVWADAVGGERGELVVIQIDLARKQLSQRETIARKRRQRELLARHGAAWSGLTGIATQCAFDRGFVDAARIPLATFGEHADAIAAAAPGLTAASASFMDPAELGLLRLLQVHPAGRALRGLEIADARITGPDAWDDVIAPRGNELLGWLLAVERMPGFRAVGMIGSGRIDQRGWSALLRPHALDRIERLAIAEALEGDALPALLAKADLPHCRAIDLGTPIDLASLLPLLPKQVVELAVAGAADAELAALAASRVGDRLEMLTISSTGFARLPIFRRVRTLALPACRVTGDEGAVVRAFVKHSMPALRELALPFSLSLESTRLIAEALGPQLDILDMRQNPQALRHLNALKPHVAGELLVGAGQTEPLLRTGPTRQLPWWDHVTLPL